jgi:hypothetical protein
VRAGPAEAHNQGSRFKVQDKEKGTWHGLGARNYSAKTLGASGGGTLDLVPFRRTLNRSLRRLRSEVPRRR